MKIYEKLSRAEGRMDAQEKERDIQGEGERERGRRGTSPLSMTAKCKVCKLITKEN